MSQQPEFGQFLDSLATAFDNASFVDRMHPHTNLLPLQRTASNEDYHYGQFGMSTSSLTSPFFQITTLQLHVVDHHRLREPPHRATTCKVRTRRLDLDRVTQCTFQEIGRAHV